MNKLFLVVSILLTLVTSMRASDDTSDLRRRIEASLEAGTGGSTARDAACQFDAVRYFYDGHLTPELIPIWLLWQQHVLRSERDGSDLIENDLVIESGRRLLAHYREFPPRSMAAFDAFMSGKATKAAWMDVSRRFDTESEALAGELWTTIEKRLDPNDLQTLRSKLLELALNMVILGRDWNKWSYEKHCN